MKKNSRPTISARKSTYRSLSAVIRCLPSHPEPSWNHSNHHSNKKFSSSYSAGASLSWVPGRHVLKTIMGSNYDKGVNTDKWLTKQEALDLVCEFLTRAPEVSQYKPTWAREGL